MLSDASGQERAILGDIRYAPNVVYLHRDARLMPKRRHAWASWNFLRWQRQDSTLNDVAVTYWMNRLQGIDDDKPLFVSLNPPFEPDPALTFGRYLCDIRNITPPPSPPRSGLAKFRASVTPGSAAPGPDTVFMRTACVWLAVAESLGATVPWRAPPPELAEAAE